MTPLEIVKAHWEASLATPYFEVVNTAVDLKDMPAIWGAMLYQPEDEGDLTLGSNPWVVESGVFVVGLFTSSGSGPAALDAAVLELKSAFHGWESNGLRINAVKGPLDIDPEADGNWWRLALTMEYERTYRRDATGPGFGDQQGLAP